MLKLDIQYKFCRLFHIFIIGTLLLYVGIYRDNIPEYLYVILFYLSIYILLFHGYKIYYNLKIGRTPWINYIHVFLIFPLLFYIGYNKKDTPRYYYELLFMLGFSAIGYNGYYLFISNE